MNRLANKIKGTQGINPFRDSQGRDFSDAKVAGEFQPISNFWNLFNDQHEILLGTRGCGKTFLLKMMRYSMLKKIEWPQAAHLVEEKKFLALYVPMHLEYITQVSKSKKDEDIQVIMFQFAFNCLLAESLIVELKSLLEEVPDRIDRMEKNIEIANWIYKVWFGKETQSVDSLSDLYNRVNTLYLNTDFNNFNYKDLPPVFVKKICTPLLAVKSEIVNFLDLSVEPHWIVCIDEAEFLNIIQQKCINSFFRSDSNQIALKVATLPFYHTTLDTLLPNIFVSPNDDFNYRVVDMKFDSIDFRNLTDSLCRNRLKFLGETDISLEKFLGKVGNDAQIDYYRLEVGEKYATQDQIEQQIIASFPARRKNAAPSYNNKRKTVYDKYAPIYFMRVMYRLSQEGNRKPGWFAGAPAVRKASQGNPRMFIQIMNDLYDKAKITHLSPKVQHGIISKYSQNFCASTKALGVQGPIIYRELGKIAKQLHRRAHTGDLVATSAAFKLKFNNSEEFEKNKRWLEVAIAYSRILVDDEFKRNGINENTRYQLAYPYAVVFWIPWRKDNPLLIHLNNDDKDYSYTVQTAMFEVTGEQGSQLSLWEDEYE